MCGNTRQAGLGLLECLRQRGPDLHPQSVAIETRVMVADILDVGQAETLHIGIDRYGRLAQPGPRPAQAAANGQGRHGRQTRRAATAQSLQQHRLGLIASMVSQQDQRSPLLRRHVGQRRIARPPGPGLDALTRLGLPGQPGPGEGQGPASPRPAQALATQVGDPFIGVGLQTVVNMQGHHTKAVVAGRPQRRVQQGGAVAPATDGDGHDRHERVRQGRSVSARWCR